MKKILACMLAVLMALSCFACNKPAEPEEPVDILAQAKDYIHAMYKDAAAKTPVDFQRVAFVTISGQKFPVVWTAEVTNDAAAEVKIVEDGSNKVTVDVPDSPEEEVQYKLTATVSADGKSYSTSFDYYVPGVPKSESGIEYVTDWKVGTAYKYGFVQANLEQTLFFAGTTSGNYLATTQDVTKAADVFVEEVEGGYRLYFMDGETKTYLDIYEYTEGKAGVRLTTEPYAVFTWNEDAKVFVAEVANDTRYMGTYNTYNTISASSTSYILGDNLSKIGVSQFPAKLATVKVSANNVDDWKVGTAYKYGFVQANLNQTLYFAGAMNGNYMATTTDFTKAADVFVEEVEGGYRLYFMDGETKTYLDIHEYTEGKAGVRLTTEPYAVFTWNADAKVFVAEVANDTRYLGTYNTYNTISASSTSYILGDNLSKIGVSQFPAKLMTVATPAKAVTPVVGTGYKYGFYQANLDQMLFLAGYMSGNYMATTANPSEAVDVYIEDVEGGTRIYFMDGETKTYLDIYEYAEGKLGCHLTTEPTAVFTWNEDAKVFVAEVGPEVRYLGTYNTYNTISSSNTSYILGDNLSKIGVSQFPCMFYVIGF